MAKEKNMTHEELMTKRAITQIGLAEEELLNGDKLKAVVMLENAAKQVKQITSESPEEKLLNAVLGRTKICITIPAELLNSIKTRANELQIPVSTCITMLINRDIELKNKKS